MNLFTQLNPKTYHAWTSVTVWTQTAISRVRIQLYGSSQPLSGLDFDAFWGVAYIAQSTSNFNFRNEEWASAAEGGGLQKRQRSFPDLGNKIHHIFISYGSRCVPASSSLWCPDVKQITNIQQTTKGQCGSYSIGCQNIVRKGHGSLLLLNRTRKWK